MKIDGTRSNDRATEVVLAYYSAFNRGDWAGMLALLDDAVVHELNHGPREIGKPAFAAFLRKQAGYRERLHDIVVMASPDGARAAAEYVAHGECRPGPTAPGRAGADRRRYARAGGAFFTLHDGRINRVSSYHPRPDDEAPAG